ncbi:MAG: PspC domain-containing protein [Defluviitaleaceae bacterium]|nr:PspC domain-containing protein [Defluviitaleaceae bacterium]
MKKKLCLSKKNKVFAGVCGGFGEFFHIDPVIIRILWVLIGLPTYFVLPLVLYVVCWAIMPMQKD